MTATTRDEASAPRVQPTIADLFVGFCGVAVAGFGGVLPFARRMVVERRRWLTGPEFTDLLALGAITVTVNLNLNYRRECRQGERLTVVTRPERLGRTSFALRQELRKSDGTLAADAVVTLVTIDPASRSSRPVPEELARPFRP